MKTCVLDVVKGEKVKPVFEEPPNPTNVEISLQQMKANDPSLQEVNLNNIKVFHCDYHQSLNLSWGQKTYQRWPIACFHTCLQFFVVTELESRYPIQKKWVLENSDFYNYLKRITIPELSVVH